VTIRSLPADSRGPLFPIGRYLCRPPPSDSPAGFLGFELRGHRRLGHERRSLPVELAARALVDSLDGSAHPGRNDMRGIQDDDADEAIAGFVREPETRHASNL
jgi:hypothetical protein